MLFSPPIYTSHSIFQSRNLRFSTYLVFCIALLLSANAQAIDLTAVGPGGGGWLYAGAFDPADPRVMMIGTDMCGVFRTTDKGGIWKPWNYGLQSDQPNAVDQISYVQDLIVIRRNGGNAENYAATLGGIFKSVGVGPWQRDTAGTKYQHSYTNDQYSYTLSNASIPFSCLAYSGGDALYAGAGANRVGEIADHWNGTELERYPGLGDRTRCSDYQYCSMGSSYYGSNQYTVWKKDLNSSASDAWEPLMINGNQHGVARDITAATVNNTNYIVVSTLHGIWLYTDHGTYWSEVELSTLPLYDDDGNVSTTYYGDELLCWNVYLTTRGVLYASMHLFHVNNAAQIIPGGVYRLFLVPLEQNEAGKWYWVGNDEPLDNGEESPPTFLQRTMAQVGTDTKTDTCSTDFYFQTGNTVWLMNVIEGSEVDPDIILLGSRFSSQYSMIRGVQPYEAQINPAGRATWGCRVFRSGGIDYMYDAPGSPAERLEVGHLNFWGTSVIFQPVVFRSNPGESIPQDETPALVQFNGMVHRSDDAGLTWENIYGDWEAGGWSGRGYDEMQVHDLDFHSDGRVIEAARDDGLYSSTNIVHSSWNRHRTALYHHNRSGTGVAVWTDSPVGELVMATVGDYKWDDGLYMYYPGLVAPDSMLEVSLASVLPATVGIYDLEMASSGIMFATYRYYVEDENDGHYVYGVIRGTWDVPNNIWVWSRVDTGLTFTKSRELEEFNNVTMDLEYMPQTGRVFCATGSSPNLFMLESPTSSTWIEIHGNWESMTYYSIHEMSSSSSEGVNVLLFGVSPNGASMSGSPGYVFRTEQAGLSVESMTWDVFALPSVLPSGEAPQIYTVAISPFNPRSAYFGINLKGTNTRNMVNVGCLHSYTGLWRLDIAGGPGQWTHTWTYEFSQTMAEGVVVEDIAFNPAVHGQLVIATGGQGLYYSQIPPPSEPVTAKYVNKSTSVVGLDYPGIPYSEITLDYDNDGREDLLVTLQAGPPRLYRNAEDGNNGVPEYAPIQDAFDEDINDLLSARGCAAADYNNDGYVDLFIAHETHPMLLRNRGPNTTPRFANDGPSLNYQVIEDGQTVTHYYLEKSWAGTWGDMNNDGLVDLLVTRADAAGATKLQGTHLHRPFVLLLNQSTSSQTAFALMAQLFNGNETPPITASSASWADIDADGWLDLFLPSLGDPADTRLYHRTAPPYYADEFAARFPGVELGGVDAAVWADLNRDGLPDMISTDRGGGRLRLFMNDPAVPGHFIDCSVWADATGPTTDLRPVDFDLDGWTDLVAVADETTTQPGVHLLRNTGDVELPGGFPYFKNVSSEAGYAAESERVSGMAAADFLNDGDVDILLGRERAHNTCYFSAVAADGVTEPPSSHWLGVRLNAASAANNSSGIGAMVTVEANGASTTQVVDGGSGLGGQQCAALRFGLGDVSSGVTVRTRWPGGFEQIIDNVTVDSEETIQDETDPTVIESSLVANAYYIPNNTLTWVLTWDTAYSYAPDCDRVLIAAPGLAPITYAPGDPGVIATNGIKNGGGYWHRFQINGVKCDGGNYAYSVVSDTHAPQFTEHTTASGNFMSYFCTHGGGEPNVEE